MPRNGVSKFDSILIPIKSTIDYQPTPTFIIDPANKDVLRTTDEIQQEEKSPTDLNISPGEANSPRLVEFEVEETEKSSVDQSIFSFGDGLLPQLAVE